MLENAKAKAVEIADKLEVSKATAVEIEETRVKVRGAMRTLNGGPCAQDPKTLNLDSNLGVDSHSTETSNPSALVWPPTARSPGQPWAVAHTAPVGQS